MPYTHTNFITAKTQLSTRLHDISKQFWSDTELGQLIIESLYTWQLLTNYWRDRAVFNTAPGTIFYNLHSVLAAGVLDYNINTQTSIASMQYRLLEPATPTVWTGSLMFTLADLVTALQNRRNRFLVDTGSVITELSLPIAPPTISREQLTDNVIDVIRFAWKDPANILTSLWRNYEYNATAYDPNWAISPGMPEMYSVLSTPPLVLQVIPPPIDTGSMELLVVLAPADLNPALASNLVNIPDNSEWIARWGAISDLLLREGESYDPIRGSYAQARYNHGVQVATLHRHGLQFEIDGNPVIPSSVFDYDVYDPEWHNTTGTPADILLVGQNILATNPVSDAIHSITIDLVRNAVIPTLDTDFIQVGRQDLDVILGYAEHIGAFKLGAGEFQATMPLLESFMHQASGYNSRLRELNDQVLTSAQSTPTILPSSTPIAESIEESSNP